MVSKENYRCCLYERGGEDRYICTTDDECPELEGWRFVGSWGVDSCDDCKGERGAATSRDDLVIRLPPPEFLELSEEQARSVRFILEWLKEHYGDE